MKPLGHLIKILFLLCFFLGSISGFAKTVHPSIAQQGSKAFFIDSDIILNDFKTVQQIEDLLNQINLPNSTKPIARVIYVTEEKLPLADGTTSVITWGYDDAGNLIAKAEKVAGRLAFKGSVGEVYDAFVNAGFREEKVGNVIKIYTNDNKLLAEILEDHIIFKYEGWGKDIITDPNNTTTLIAKFYDMVDAPDTSWVKEVLPKGTYGRGQAKKGGINILDVDQETYLGLREEATDILNKLGNKKPTTDEITEVANEIFWNRYNLPFLEEAFARGDNIRLLSEPNNLFSATSFYKREIEVITQGWKKPDGTFIQPLKEKYNYKYNESTNTYEKIK